MVLEESFSILACELRTTMKIVQSKGKFMEVSVMRSPGDVTLLERLL